jgi:hypothetical protein
MIRAADLFGGPTIEVGSLAVEAAINIPTGCAAQ